jgi:Flp pilus assembly protein TadD
MLGVATAVCLLVPSVPPGFWRGDLVTLKSGEQLEGLVVHVDEREVRLRRGVGGMSVTRLVSMADVVEIRLAQPQLSEFRSIARKLESDRWTTEATDLWRQVCILRPEGVSDRLRLSQMLRREGNLEEAAAAVAAAAKADPADPRVPLEQGELALAQGDGPAAVKFAREALRLSASDPAPGRWLLGRGLERCGLPDDALLEYRTLLRGDPRQGEVLERFVALSMEEKKAEAAIPELERLTRAAPDQRSGWIALGRLLYRLGRFPDAAEAFRTATGLGGAGYNRARVFFQCSLARRFSRDPGAVLSAADLHVAIELDPTLRRDSP